ncbi:MAG: serine--tRNA ligase [Planctomycetes bacterium]|nr:serine--tRNA ligase [Planctomycetota bacterium]
MLDIKRIREKPDEVREGISAKGGDGTLVERAIELDKRLRELKTQTENLRAEQKKKSGDFGRLKKEGGDIAKLQNELNDLKAKLAVGDDDLTRTEKDLQAVLDDMPNVPHKDVPRGTSAEQNVVVKSWGDIPKIANPKPHWEIGKAFGFEQERASRMSGAGFQLFLGPLAKLERALIQYFLHEHTEKNGYTEAYCPFLVRPHALYGTGQLPKFQVELFHAERDDLYLIPTAETPLTNIHADEILAESDLPKRYCGYTPCFRREKGAAGADTRGMVRGHQFTKVEMMEFQHPAKSYEAHETLTRNAEKLLEGLELPYKRVLICTGDSSAANAKQYDLEVYAVGVARWLEDSVTGKNEFVHTLNGSGLATSRIIPALLENNLQPDGSVRLPKALHAYYGKATL